MTSQSHSHSQNRSLKLQEEITKSNFDKNDTTTTLNRGRKGNLNSWTHTNLHMDVEEREDGEERLEELEDALKSEILAKEELECENASLRDLLSSKILDDRNYGSGSNRLEEILKS